MVVQWLGLHAFTTEGLDLIPGWGTKIPQIAQKTKKLNKTETPLENPPVYGNPE